MNERGKYTFEVTQVETSDVGTYRLVIGKFSSFAESARKAESNIRFSHGMRDYDEGSCRVSFSFLLLSRPEVEIEVEEPLTKMIDGEECIRTDGGSYEVITN